MRDQQLSIDKKALREKIKAFLEGRKEIFFAYLFGSFLEEDYFRDIDVGIYVDETEPVTRDTFYDIVLSTEIESFAKFPVDIIVLNRESSSMVFNASKGELLKNTDDELRENFVTMHWKMYWDWRVSTAYHFGGNNSRPLLEKELSL
jgi:predicted nucleotidyltransferase